MNGSDSHRSKRSPSYVVTKMSVAKRRRKLLEDCMILCVALVLTEPHTTPAQRKLIPGLIKRLRKELA